MSVCALGLFGTQDLVGVGRHRGCLVGNPGLRGKFVSLRRHPVSAGIPETLGPLHLPSHSVGIVTDVPFPPNGQGTVSIYTSSAKLISYENTQV